jgi:methylmalonyl-CoA/ethylmalonyl-CoA epimerase
MILHQVAQRATDLERAKAFCVEILGATFIAQFDPPGLLFLNLSNTRLLLEKGAPSSLLYFLIDDVESEIARLRSLSVSIETEPHVIFKDEEGIFGKVATEEKMAFIRDSEDNLVGLVSRHQIG